MELSLILLKQVSVMLILICIGAICFKTRLVSLEGNKSLTNLVLYIVNPAVIIVSYQQDFSPRLFKGLGYALLLSAAGLLLFIAVSYLFLRGKNKDSISIERINASYSNCGFMGIPLALALFGSEGVLYITAINTVFNIMVWTHGVFTISGEKSEVSFKKIITNPTILATVLGFLLFVFQIRIPGMLFNTLSYVNNIITPLAMFVAGVTIANSSLLKALRKPRIYFVSALKLIITPVILILLLYLFPCPNETAKITTIVGLSCPSATIGTMLAIRFDKNSSYSSQMFGLSTILSVVTLPIIVYIAKTVGSLF